MPPAARMGDMHMCPMVTPATPPIPHVGGPITLGCPTVLIGMMPAARVGDMAICVGPPDSIVLGSFTVMIGGQPAARMGDLTAHGGTVAMGFPTVMIGDAGGGPGAPSPGSMQPPGALSQGEVGSMGVETPAAEGANADGSNQAGSTMPQAPPTGSGPPQGTAMSLARQSGSPFVEHCS